MWMVRAGRGGEHADAFVEKKIVAFGNDRLGALSPKVTKDELLKLFADKYPEEKEGTRSSWASQLFRFISEVKPDDEVIFFDRDRRRYVVGKISSDYEWVPDAVEGKPHARKVVWSNEVSRDVLSPATRNTLGSTLTVFKLPADAEKDIHAHLVSLGESPSVVRLPTAKEEEKQVEALSLITDDTFEKANEFIEDMINALDWKQMQDLVAGVLRGMGYRTTVSAEGPDRGVDVFASPDGLGLQDPRIFVEVKHRTKEIGSKDIRSFLGGRGKNDKCLYVSTGGFTREARYEAERAEVALQLVTLPTLRQLVVDFYDKLDAETRAMVPLRRLYWPARR